MSKPRIDPQQSLVLSLLLEHERNKALFPSIKEDREKGIIRRCYLCRKSILNWTYDHIVPLFLGGIHRKCNVEAICHNCNKQKGQYERHLHGIFAALNKQLKEHNNVYELYEKIKQKKDSINALTRSNQSPE